MTVASSPSHPPTEIGPVNAHETSRPVEPAATQGGVSRTAADEGQGGTGASPVAGSGTFTGGGNASGGGGPGTGGGGSGAGQAGSSSYVAAQFTYIRGLILKNLVYPAEARRAGLGGRVTVGFIIFEDGLVRNIRIVESSGHDLLDRTVIEAVKRCQPFPRPPGRAELIVPILFKLK